MSARTLPPHPLAPERRLLQGRELGGLIIALLLVAAPHAIRVPGWVIALTLVLYAWRVAIHLHRWVPPGRTTMALLSVAGVVGVWLEYRLLFGRVPGIAFLVVFSGLKLLESRSHRDAAAVALLAFFLLMTTFLYSQSIPVAALMGAALYVVTVTLVGGNAPGRPLVADLRAGAVLLAQAVPVALVLFLLFPRIQGPGWGMPQDVRAGTTGLSDSMSPGNVSQVAQSDALVFRADFSGAIPPPQQRYWRGPVLWDFDGRTWRAGTPLIRRAIPQSEGGQTHRYSVMLEPYHDHWLFALEMPVTLPPNAAITVDGQLLSVQPIRTRQRYDMVSVADGQTDPRENAALLRRALELPRGSNPQAAALARQWRDEAQSAEEVLHRAIDFFRQGKYQYTLEPPLLGHDAIDEFLFLTREGFCEHFSSAFAFLLRAAGVPARVVTGYLGGDPNPIDGILTVRQSDAHAWVEAYLPGRGWLRLDPTAASIPGRLSSGMARSMQSGAALPLLIRPDLDWLRGLRHRWDAVVHQWNLRVLGYNPERQRELMSWIGMPRSDWQELVVALVGALGVIALALIAWSLKRTRRPDPVQEIWMRFCAKLARQDVARAPQEGPRDFCMRAAQRLPAAAEAIRAIAERYIALRYGADAGETGVRDLQRRVRELRLA